MMNGGKNDFIQAVLQCFMTIDSIAEFYILKLYQGPDEDDDDDTKQASKNMRQVFGDMFQTPIECLEPY